MHHICVVLESSLVHFFLKEGRPWSSRNAAQLSKSRSSCTRRCFCRPRLFFHLQGWNCVSFEILAVHQERLFICCCGTHDTTVVVATLARRKKRKPSTVPTDQILVHLLINMVKRQDVWPQEHGAATFATSGPRTVPATSSPMPPTVRRICRQQKKEFGVARSSRSCRGWRHVGTESGGVNTFRVLVTIAETLGMAGEQTRSGVARSPQVQDDVCDWRGR